MAGSGDRRFVGCRRAELRTAGAVGNCPGAERALRDGELSLAQAGEIVSTEADCPGSETELVELATASGLAVLRDEARKRRLAAVDVGELAARQRKARSFRHWRDGEGMVRFSGALEPRHGVGLMHAIEAEAQRIRRKAGRDGGKEPVEAHAADAFVAVASGQAARGRTEVVFVCDLRAYRRGHAHAGEPCHAVGGGPVPVSVIRDELEDAFVKAVLHTGVRIDTVAHFGRHIPAALRTALDLGTPPGFEGAVCSEPGCGRTWGLEYDHVDPVANGGLTSDENLKPKCRPCHWEKTERDRAAGLLGSRQAGGSEGRGGPDPPSPC